MAPKISKETKSSQKQIVNGFYIEDDFKPTNGGKAVLKALKHAGLKKFMTTKTQILTNLCDMVTRQATRDVDTGTISLTYKSQVIKITPELVSEVYDIPINETMVKNIWNRDINYEPEFTSNIQFIDNVPYDQEAKFHQKSSLSLP